MQGDRLLVFDAFDAFRALDRLRLFAHLIVALGHGRPHSRIEWFRQGCICIVVDRIIMQIV